MVNICSWCLWTYAVADCGENWHAFSASFPADITMEIPYMRVMRRIAEEDDANSLERLV